MKEINIIDLDNTLIPFDSFREYLFRFLSLKNIPQIFLIITLRKLTLISAGRFKELIINIYRKRNSYKNEMIEFAHYLYWKRNTEVEALVKSYSSENSINILLTASPSDYARPLSTKLGWEFIASEKKGNSFFHVYGERKICILKEVFPNNIYKYNFSISDNLSDKKLLSLFTYPYFISNKIISKI